MYHSNSMITVGLQQREIERNSTSSGITPVARVRGGVCPGALLEAPAAGSPRVTWNPAGSPPLTTMGRVHKDSVRTFSSTKFFLLLKVLFLHTEKKGEYKALFYISETVTGHMLSFGWLNVTLSLPVCMLARSGEHGSQSRAVSLTAPFKLRICAFSKVCLV